MMTLDERIPALLLPWYAQNRRDLPWRADRLPYHVWLSEIMLQQTRVEAVRGYYTRFLAELPDIAALATCPEDRLTKLWEGLGYYTRVRNLQKAARVVMDEYGGEFPQNFDNIRALPGVGDYTAGAVASICFEKPTPAVDGNVLRVVSRLLNDHRPTDDVKLRREYRDALADIYPAGRCGEFTQALMELGATLCGPNSAPRCEHCPLASLCRGFADGTAAQLPVRAAKKERRVEEKTVFVLRCDGACAVKKRGKTGLLAGLWELPNVPGLLSAQAAVEQAAHWGVQPCGLQKSLERAHIFTHIRWQMRCYYIDCTARADGFVWADAARFARDIALPTAFRMFWEEEKDG